MHAVIDIGSNSILLLVAERDERGQLTVATDQARIARLSEGVNGRGTLSDAAIERSLKILAEYKELADRHHAPITALATEGLRMASDAQRFLGPAHRALGVPVQIISGDQEARGSYLSVAHELRGEPAAPLRVIDIGGASTELVVGHGLEVESMVSHRVGSVRLTERHVADPTARISAAEIVAIADDARAALAKQPLPPLSQLHGVAGTVTTTSAILLQLETYDSAAVDGSRFRRAQITALRDGLAGQTLEQRLVHPTLSPKRADVLVAGLTILDCALEHCGASELVVRDRGVRYAYIPGPEEAGPG